MGYTTDFEGSFKVTPTLRNEDKLYLKKFAETRRMARNLPEEYGIEGEFYVEGSGWAGQDFEPTVIDYNTPPSTQPGLWCQWIPNRSGTKIGWDGGEKFYNYVEWIEYLIDNILHPRGYTLNGVVKWYGEERTDTGTITIKDNIVDAVADEYDMLEEDEEDEEDEFDWESDEDEEDWE